MNDKKLYDKNRNKMSHHNPNTMIRMKFYDVGYNLSMKHN